MKRLTAGLALIAVIIAALGGAVAVAQTPRPVAQYLFRTEGLPLSGPYDVAHHINVFEPGATTPWHTHPGLVLVTVIEGELTFRTGGTEKVYKVGESFVERPDEVGQATNRTAARTSVIASFIVPRGTPLSTEQPAPAAPASAPAPAAPAPPALPEAGGPLDQPVALPDTGAERWNLPVLVLATVLVLSGLSG